MTEGEYQAVGRQNTRERLTTQKREEIARKVIAESARSAVRATIAFGEPSQPYIPEIVNDFWDSPLTQQRAELEWQNDALCAQADPEAFFPEKGGSTRDAKRVCSSCDVRGECLQYALDRDERFGIWGGLSERERRKLKRRA